MNAKLSSAATIIAHGQFCSRYVQRLLAAEPMRLTWLLENLASPITATQLQDWLEAQPNTSEAELFSALRDIRKRTLLKLICRDLSGLADLAEVVSSVTALAELSVRRAHQLATELLTQQFGQPIGEESGQPQTLMVIGMGKLGGGELNVSSDIDLIFTYAEEGACNGARSLSNHEFFSRVGKKIINLINELTSDGFVFRVDMRLRPYGDSGALVMSLSALERDRKSVV